MLIVDGNHFMNCKIRSSRRNFDCFFSAEMQHGLVYYVKAYAFLWIANMISNHRYNKPWLIWIWFDWWFYPVYVKVQINQRWWFLAWRHPSTEILTSENHLNWIHSRPNNGLSQNQNKFIDVFTLVHQNNNCHIQAVVSYL